MPQISQREAVRLRRRVHQLEEQLKKMQNAWVGEWPSYTVICRITPNEKVMACVETARRLKHAVVAAPQGNEIAFFASNLTF